MFLQMMLLQYVGSCMQLNAWHYVSIWFLTPSLVMSLQIDISYDSQMPTNREIERLFMSKLNLIGLLINRKFSNEYLFYN